MIPHNFTIIHAGETIKGNENVTLLERVNCFHCRIIKPKPEAIERLNTFIDSFADIKIIETEITAEYHRCLQGRDAEMRESVLNDYKNILTTILANFQKNASDEDYDIHTKGQLEFYLKGLIQAIEAIAQLKNLKSRAETSVN